MPKIIVTHTNPDLDAIAAIWLFKRLNPDFKEAQIEFVPAGETYQGKPVDSNPKIVHVDTGLGKFDHHQTRERTCAAEKVLNSLLKEKPGQLESPQALKRMTVIVTEVDHFENCYWPQADNDRYEFFLPAALDGYKSSGQISDQDLVELGMKALDGVYARVKQKIEAEQELKTKGQEFENVWGKALAIASQNKAVEKLALKNGYVLVVRKDPESGNVRIKAQPKSTIDLSKAYKELKKKDPQVTWFLHVSKRMLLNGTRKDPTMKPSRLSLEAVVETLKKEGNS